MFNESSSAHELKVFLSRSLFTSLNLSCTNDEEIAEKDQINFCFFACFLLLLLILILSLKFLLSTDRPSCYSSWKQ